MDEAISIIVVDDEQDIRETLKEYFVANGVNVDLAADGKQMRELVETNKYDLAILDLRLPGEDGLSICRYLRETTSMGVLMLTGSGDTIDRVVGLEVGADDYVSKPFDLRELLARVRSIVRRTTRIEENVEDSGPVERSPDAFAFGPVSVNPNARTITLPDGTLAPITSMEFDLLKAFADRPNRVLSRDLLLEQAHNRDWEPFDRSIDIRVTRLRKKIEPNPERPRFIKTVRGVGYIYDPKGE